jgi:hypothetical protein
MARDPLGGSHLGALRAAQGRCRGSADACARRPRAAGAVVRQAPRQRRDPSAAGGRERADRPARAKSRQAGPSARERRHEHGAPELCARALRQQPSNGVWVRGHAVSFLGLSNAEHALRRLPRGARGHARHLSRYQAVAAADPAVGVPSMGSDTRCCDFPEKFGSSPNLAKTARRNRSPTKRSLSTRR